jgi:hypothetical protein
MTMMIVVDAVDSEVDVEVDVEVTVEDSVIAAEVDSATGMVDAAVGLEVDEAVTVEDSVIVVLLASGGTMVARGIIPLAARAADLVVEEVETATEDLVAVVMEALAIVRRGGSSTEHG